MDSKQRVHEPFVTAAIILALTAGFGYGAILVSAGIFMLPLGALRIALVQAHGHVQLFGWSGLFILGVALFFLPRLRGTILAHPETARYALAAWVIGITLRALAQPMGAISEGSMLREVLSAALAASGIIELAGVALVIEVLARTFRRAPALGPGAPIRPVQPLLAMAAASLSSAIIFNAVLGLGTALSNSFVFPSLWEDALTHLTIYGFIIPIAFAMSVRNLPLFLRLAAPPRRELLPLTLVYVTGLAFTLSSGMEQMFEKGHTFSSFGAILENGSILVFIWMLDVLLRRKPAWTTNRVEPPPDYVETRKPTRKNYPDHGEFGRFELLVISAFIWLALAAIFGLVNNIAALLDVPIPFNPDIGRHSITLGFITLLVFGMAVRLIPGFSGKSRVASTRLVLATFWLGNLSALCRVAPLLAPDAPGAGIAYASSGAIGWAAVLCLGMNLRQTLRMN